jgi:pilus assembly protein CpaC
MSISVDEISKYACLALMSSLMVATLLAQSATASPTPVVPGVAGSGAAISGFANMATLPEATTALNTRAEFASKSLHILVGRSIFISSLTRFKRVYVSDPLIVDSFTSSSTQIVVTAKIPGVSTLILWDEKGQSQVYLISSDIDATNLQEQLHLAFPNDSIRVNADQDHISLIGTVASDAESDAASKLATLYGKSIVNSLVVQPPHLRQVKLRVQMIEVDRTKLESFGINLLTQGRNTSSSQTGQFPAIAATTTTSSAGSVTPPTLAVSNPLNLLFYNSGLNIGLVLQDLQNKNIAQILAEPTITTLSGQRASFLSGGEFPFPVIQGSSGGLTSITIQFRPYGVKLDFTPFVNKDGTIQLKVAPEVSALDFTNAVTISGYTIPAISTRRAETQVELRDGQTFAISGLLDHRTTDILSKMPGIGDLPILGPLFRSKNITHSTVELVVFVTATLVDPLTDRSTPTPPELPIPMLDPAAFGKTSPEKSPVAKPKQGTGGKP